MFLQRRVIFEFRAVSATFFHRTMVAQLGILGLSQCPGIRGGAVFRMRGFGLVVRAIEGWPG